MEGLKIEYGEETIVVKTIQSNKQMKDAPSSECEAVVF